MDTITAKLRERWESDKIRLRSGLPANAIEAFESKYNVVLPLDLRHYHLHMDGMEEGETDNDLFAFLPLCQIKSVTEELTSFAGIPDYSDIADNLPEAHCYFVFVDYMIMSHVYAIRLSSDVNAPTPVLWICGPFWEEIASSFSAFIERYLTDTNSIFSHKWDDSRREYFAKRYPNQTWSLRKAVKSFFRC